MTTTVLTGPARVRAWITDEMAQRTRRFAEVWNLELERDAHSITETLCTRSGRWSVPDAPELGRVRCDRTARALAIECLQNTKGERVRLPDGRWLAIGRNGRVRPARPPNGRTLWARTAGGGAWSEAATTQWLTALHAERALAWRATLAPTTNGSGQIEWGRWVKAHTFDDDIEPGPEAEEWVGDETDDMGTLAATTWIALLGEPVAKPVPTLIERLVSGSCRAYRLPDGAIARIARSGRLRAMTYPSP